MASFTLDPAGVFPEGTNVGAYPESNWAAHLLIGGPQGAAVGAATETQAVSGGAVAFVALADGTAYIAGAEVASVWRYVRFRTSPAPDTFSRGQVVDGTVDEVQLRVQANATQTNDLVVFEDSSGSDLLVFEPARLRLHDGGGDEPEIQFNGSAGGFSMGLDSAAATPGRDFFIGKEDHPAPGSFRDAFYIGHNGANPPTVAIGPIGEPTDLWALSVSSDGDELDMAGIRVRREAFTAANQGGGAFYAELRSATVGIAQYVGNWASGNVWGIGPLTSANDNMVRIGVVQDEQTGQWRSAADQILGLEIAELRVVNQATNKFRVNATGIGFYATTPIAKPTVTGAKGSNAALGSLMTALANLGLVTDSTSA